MASFSSWRAWRAVLAAALLFGCAAAPGCVPVKPWQRELLAKPKMQLDPDPEAVLLKEHVHEYREGSAGGYGGGGGGCGCN